MVINGRVARQLRNLCRYKDEDISPPQLLVKRKTKGHTLVLNPEGEYTAPEGFSYDIKEVEHDVCQLHADPTRQVYQDLKKQWYEFTALDHKAVKDK